MNAAHSIIIVFITSLIHCESISMWRLVYQGGSCNRCYRWLLMWLDSSKNYLYYLATCHFWLTKDCHSGWVYINIVGKMTDALSPWSHKVGIVWKIQHGERERSNLVICDRMAWGVWEGRLWWLCRRGLWISECISGNCGAGVFERAAKTIVGWNQ